MGARAYRYLALYEPAPGCIVEVGSERGEGSTAWLVAYAHRHRLGFYTADVDPDVHRAAERLTKGARLCTGCELLRRVGTVSVAYLDGFDWIPDKQHDEPWIQRQRQRYREVGYEMTNENCQREHLAEARLVARKAAGRCVVICDDTYRTGDGWSGKGGLAVPYLEDAGFRVVADEASAGESLGCAVLTRG